LLTKLAKAKRDDARILLDNRRWATSYYLYGLSVELALKAVIAKNVSSGTIQEKGFENAFYSHKLEALLALAGLKADLDRELGDAQFKANWEFVRGWNVESRYDDVEEARARAISNAVDDRNAGIFRWLTTHF
jgi:hypothetical protein